jgi:hypothetical protein
VIKIWPKLILVGLAAFVGCNRSSFPVAPVRGMVKIDGQPMRQGKVMFAPVATGGKLNSGRPGFGIIGDDGSFTLSTYGDGDGAVVGDHWISIINAEPLAGATASPPATRITKVTKQNFQRIVFPRKVVAVVAHQENQIEIAMTSQDIEKFGKLAKTDD